MTLQSSDLIQSIENPDPIHSMDGSNSWGQNPVLYPILFERLLIGNAVRVTEQ